MGRPKALLQRNYRQEQLDAGLCVIVGCGNEPLQDQRKCQRHRDMTQASRKANDREKIRSNRCTYGKCGKPLVKGLQLCTLHTEEAAAACRKWRYGFTDDNEQQFKAAINCDWCGNPFNNSTPRIDHDHTCCSGKRSCGKCLRGFLHESCNLHGVVWAEWLERTFGVIDERLREYRSKF